MLSFSNILIPGSRAAFHVTNNSNGPTTCTYSFCGEGERLHYSLTKRGPILHEHQKGKCGNPISVFVGLSRPPVIDPANIVSFFETFGNLTPFYEGYYDGNSLWAASRRLLCLLELTENYCVLSPTNPSEATILKQFSNCIELLAFSSHELYSSQDDEDSYSGNYFKNKKTNEVIICSPYVFGFMSFILGWNPENDAWHMFTTSSFELTQERIKSIEDALQNLSKMDDEMQGLYFESNHTLPTGNELEFFKLIMACSQFVRFYKNEGRIVVEVKPAKAGENSHLSAIITPLKRLSTLVIERELNYYVQPIQYGYFFDKQEAVPEISCVHQLMYFSLMALEPYAVYVDCSREKCRNKTVKLFGDKIIPCCCTSCRTAAASQRSREKNKPGKTVLSEKR